MACTCCVWPVQARGMSIKAMPMSLVMEAQSGKSYLLNLIDCPGETYVVFFFCRLPASPLYPADWGLHASYKLSVI